MINGTFWLLAFDTDTDETIQSISELLAITSLPAKANKKTSSTSKRRKAMIESWDDSADGGF
jgi:hypothetical protein